MRITKWRICLSKRNFRRGGSVKVFGRENNYVYLYNIEREKNEDTSFLRLCSFCRPAAIDSFSSFYPDDFPVDFQVPKVFLSNF